LRHLGATPRALALALLLPDEESQAAPTGLLPGAGGTDRHRHRPCDRSPQGADTHPRRMRQLRPLQRGPLHVPAQPRRRSRPSQLAGDRNRGPIRKPHSTATTAGSTDGDNSTDHNGPSTRERLSTRRTEQKMKLPFEGGLKGLFRQISDKAKGGGWSDPDTGQRHFTPWAWRTRNGVYVGWDGSVWL